MKARAFNINDVAQIKELHSKYFPEFDFPDFLNGYLMAFTLTDDYDKIIMAGGIRAIGETVLVTDKSVNLHLLGDALLQALDISKHVCRRFNIERLHAFVEDAAYERHLIKHGFSSRSKALQIKV